MSFGIVGDPADREGASPLGADRSPDRFVDFERLRRTSGHLNLFLEDLHPPPAIRGAIAKRVRWIGFQFHEVGPISLRVRESPGHVAGASGDHRGDSRQGEPSEPGVSDVQFGAVPDVRHSEGQVHVARQQRGAAGGPPRRYRPGIASRNRRRFRWLEGMAPAGCGEDRGPRNLRNRKRFAVQRGVPVRARRVQERCEFGGQRRLERRGPRLVGSGRVVQDEIHRHHGQQGVADAPGGWFLSQEQVFERRRRQPGEPGSHPVPVGLEGPARLGRKCFHRPLGAGPHPVKTRLPVQRDRRRPGQGRQFPGGLAALQVHLEEALLGMEVPEHPVTVADRFRLDAGDSQTVPFHLGRSREPRQRDGPAQDGPARPELAAGVEAGGDRDEQQESEHATPQDRDSAPCRSASRHSVCSSGGYSPGRSCEAAPGTAQFLVSWRRFSSSGRLPRRRPRPRRSRRPWKAAGPARRT